MKTIGSVKRKSHALATLVGVSVTLALFGCDDTETKTDFNAIDASQPAGVSTEQVSTESSLGTDWQMVWNDEFDGDAIDSDKWFHEVNCTGGGNNENQCYTDSAENSFVADGNLHIVALPAQDTTDKDYTSARLSTKNLGDWKYGRFEMRAKMPFGQGTWPAFWMLPTDEVYGGWPKSGEIDIVEAVNLKTINDEGVTESYVHGTLHYGKAWPKNDESGKEYLLPNGANPADDFHTYAIEWQEGEIRWYIDGYLFQTQMASDVRYNSKDQAVGLRHRGWYSEYYDIITGDLETHWDAAPFDQNFHLLLNLAVGGDWAGNVNDGGIDPGAFINGQTFAIDYVRVYECTANPETGKGCETVRPGYKDADDALTIGAAPIPRPPSTGIAVNLTIFETTENPSWPIWGDNGEIDPTIQTDDEEHGEVVEFSIGDSNTVMGFNVFESDAPLGFDASPMLDAGTVSFEMKVVTPPANSDAVWNFKIESNGAEQEANFFLNESVEGLEPVVGEWQSYTFSLQSIADQGVDLTNIDVLMLFPTWGSGSGAVYRVDNVKIAQEDIVGAPTPELVLFENGPNPDWAPWDCCSGSIPTEETDDSEHGNTVEFVIGPTPTVMGFTAADSDKAFNASAIASDGVVQFDMKIVTAPTSSEAVWLFKIESSGGVENGNEGAAVEYNLAQSQELEAPSVGVWQTYTFKVSDLAAAGIAIDDITTIMVFPSWGLGEGTVYRIDNAKIYSPSSVNDSEGSNDSPQEDNTSQPGTLFADMAADGWVVWDCCGGTTPTLEIDDDAHNMTAEFVIGGAPTVMGFNTRSDVGGGDANFDASALLSAGVVQFEMKVVTAPADANSYWLFKIESSGGPDNGGAAVELALADSNEGAAPVTGQWQTYTFSLSDLANAGLDISDIDVVMIFPLWDTGDGAVYRVDNLKIATP